MRPSKSPLPKTWAAPSVPSALMGIRRIPPAVPAPEAGIAAYKNFLETVAKASGECPEVENGDPEMGVRLPAAAVNADIEPELAVLPTYKNWAALLKRPPLLELEHPEGDKTRRRSRELNARNTAFFTGISFFLDSEAVGIVHPIASFRVNLALLPLIPHSGIYHFGGGP